MSELPGQDAIARGFDSARERCSEQGIELPPQHWEESERPVREYIGGMSGISPGATELLAEHLGIAMAARAYYGEPALADADVEGYVERARNFFNSFWHDPPASHGGWKP